MTERLGTCAFCGQASEFSRQNLQPHERPEPWPQVYRCFLMNLFHEENPPPVQRAVLYGVDIKPGDCEACKHFQPAGAQPLGELMRRSRQRWRRRMKKRAAV